MAIELHHLQPSHDDELSRLKARIAELEEERRWSFNSRTREGCDGWGLLYVDDKMKVKEVKDSDTFELTLPALKAERLALVSIAKSLKKKEADK